MSIRGIPEIKDRKRTPMPVYLPVIALMLPDDKRATGISSAKITSSTEKTAFPTGDVGEKILTYLKKKLLKMVMYL